MRLAAIVATPVCPVLELTLGIVERKVCALQSRHWFVMIFRNVIHEELVPGKPDVNRYLETVVMLMMVPRQVDDDVTGGDSIEELVELVGAQLQMRRQRRRTVDLTTKRQLKRSLHAITSDECPADFMRYDDTLDSTKWGQRCAKYASRVRNGCVSCQPNLPGDAVVSGYSLMSTNAASR